MLCLLFVLLACCRGAIPLLRIPRHDSTNPPVIYGYCKKGDLEKLVEFLLDHPDITSQSTLIQTCFLLCTDNGHYPMVDYLLTHYTIDVLHGLNAMTQSLNRYRLDIVRLIGTKLGYPQGLELHYLLRLAHTKLYWRFLDERLSGLTSKQKLLCCGTIGYLKPIKSIDLTEVTPKTLAIFVATVLKESHLHIVEWLLRHKAELFDLAVEFGLVTTDFVLSVFDRFSVLLDDDLAQFQAPNMDLPSSLTISIMSNSMKIFEELWRYLGNLLNINPIHMSSIRKTQCAICEALWALPEKQAIQWIKRIMLIDARIQLRYSRFLFDDIPYCMEKGLLELPDMFTLEEIEGIRHNTAVKSLKCLYRLSEAVKRVDMNLILLFLEVCPDDHPLKLEIWTTIFLKSDGFLNLIQHKEDTDF